LRTLTFVKALSNYRLECSFDDGTTKIADITPFLDKEAFKPLANPHVFASVLFNGAYYVEWKNYEVDLSADTL